MTTTVPVAQSFVVLPVVTVKFRATSGLVIPVVTVKLAEVDGLFVAAKTPFVLTFEGAIMV